MLKLRISGTQDNKAYEQTSSEFSQSDLVVPLSFILLILKQGCKLSKASINKLEILKDDKIVRTYTI